MAHCHINLNNFENVKLQVLLAAASFVKNSCIVICQHVEGKKRHLYLCSQPVSQGRSQPKTSEQTDIIAQ